MRTLLVGFALASVPLAGCAYARAHWSWSPESISPEDYVRLEHETEAENERVRVAAEAVLIRQGIALAEPNRALDLVPTEPLLRTCQDLPSSEPPPASGWFMLGKDQPLQAALNEACLFLHAFGPPELDVQRSDGTKGRLLRLADHQWATHDAKGHVVLVNVRPYTTMKRVEVKTENCMEDMPQTKPDGLPDRLLGKVRVVWQQPKTSIRTVDLSYEIKMLKPVCGMVCCSR